MYFLRCFFPQTREQVISVCVDVRAARECRCLPTAATNVAVLERDNERGRKIVWNNMEQDIVSVAISQGPRNGDLAMEKNEEDPCFLGKETCVQQGRTGTMILLKLRKRFIEGNVLFTQSQGYRKGLVQSGRGHFVPAWS